MSILEDQHEEARKRMEPSAIIRFVSTLKYIYSTIPRKIQCFLPHHKQGLERVSHSSFTLKPPPQKKEKQHPLLMKLLTLRKEFANEITSNSNFIIAALLQRLGVASAI